MKTTASVRKLTGKVDSFSAVCFITVFAILALRNASLFFSAYLWAEDGPVFLRGGVINSWRSLLTPYAGYLHLLPRICTISAVAVSRLAGQGIQMAPQIMQLFALLIEAFCLTFVCSERFSWLMKKKTGRLFTAVVFAACAGSQCMEIWYTVTNLQWWCGLLIFWICMDSIYRRQLPDSLFVTGMLSCIGLSTPLGGITVLVFSGLLLYRLACRQQIRRAELFRFALVLIPTVVQGILSVTQGRTQNGSIWTAVVYSLQTLLGTVPSVLYADLFQKICQQEHWYWRIAVITLGMCIWLALAVVFWMHKRMALLLYILGFVEICLLLSFYANTAAEAVFLVQAGGRYLVLPQWAFLAAVCIALYDLLEHGIWSMAGILTGALVCTCGLHFPIGLQNTYGSVYSSASCLYQPDGQQICEIVIQPGWPWSIKIPIGLGTLKEREAQGITFGGFSIDGIMVSDGALESIFDGKNMVTVSGWIVDEAYGQDPAVVLLRCADVYYAARLVDSPDLDTAFGGNGKYLKSRYEVPLPVRELAEAGYSYEILAISQNKSEYCSKTESLTILNALE